MKTNTVSLVLGFAFLSLAAVACADSDENVATEAPNAEAAPVKGNEAASSSSSSSGSAIDPYQEVKTPSVGSDPIDTAIGFEPDAGWKPDPTQADVPKEEPPAPAADADAGSQDPMDPKSPIPLVKFGSLHAVSNVGDNCVFSVDGITKGTGSSLDLKLVIGTHIVGCMRDDGTTADESVLIQTGMKSDVVLKFDTAELTLVAVGGVCSFAVDGEAKGTAASLTFAILPGKHTILCEQNNGGTQTHVITVKPAEIAMSTFIVLKK